MYVAAYTLITLLSRIVSFKEHENKLTLRVHCSYPPSKWGVVANPAIVAFLVTDSGQVTCHFM